jgi:hypothetical protein
MSILDTNMREGLTQRGFGKSTLAANRDFSDVEEALHLVTVKHLDKILKRITRIANGAKSLCQD